MASVYGPKRLAANVECETWIERFTQLEPAGGVRLIVELAWSCAPTLNQTSAAHSMNGPVEMKAVYGPEHRSSYVGARETWMDRFTKLEPDGGFRTIVERVWNNGTRKSEEHLTRLAA
jgi:hypothetical protein